MPDRMIGPPPRPERTAPAPSPVGRMIIFALARAEGLTYLQAMHLVERFVRPGAREIPELEAVLAAVEEIQRTSG